MFLAIGFFIFFYGRRRGQRLALQPRTTRDSERKPSWFSRRLSWDGLPKRVSVTSTECSVSGPLIQLNPTASIPNHAIEAPPGRTADTHEADSDNGVATRLSPSVPLRGENVEIYEVDNSERPAELEGADRNIPLLGSDRATSRTRSM